MAQWKTITDDATMMMTSGERMATYDRELRTLKQHKRESTRELNDRIKAIEKFMGDLAEEILEATGAPTGNLFGKGKDD